MPEIAARIAPNKPSPETRRSRESMTSIAVVLVVVFAGLPLTINAIYMVLWLSRVKASTNRSDDNG